MRTGTAIVKGDGETTIGTAKVRWVEKVDDGLEVIFELKDDPDLLRQIEIADGAVGSGVKAGDLVEIACAGQDGPYELTRIFEKDPQTDEEAAK